MLSSPFLASVVLGLLNNYWFIFMSYIGKNESFNSSFTTTASFSFSSVLLLEMFSEFYSSTAPKEVIKGEESIFLGLRMLPKLLVEEVHSDSKRDMQLDVPVLGLSSKS